MDIEPGKLLRRRVRANLLQVRYASELRSLRYYGLFIGYPRSGHTLVASLLDAHENMLFSNGLHAAYYLTRGFNVRQVAVLSIWNSRRFTRRGRRSNGYAYRIPDGSHGTWQRLHVVGDKSGDLFSYQLRREPEALQAVAENLSSMARFVHVIRNPYDCISSMATRGRIPLQSAMADFWALCETNAAARSAIPGSMWIDVHLEDLILRPEHSIRAMCRFFDQECADRYLSGCTQFLFKAPRQSSLSVDWRPELVAEVRERMRLYPWFDGYAFDHSGRFAH